MDDQYKSLTGKSFENNILFIGQYACPPNYFYRGNNVRDNYVIHYILDGEGTFSSANHPAVTLKKGDLFILPKDVPCFYQADGQNPWKYFWIGLSGTKIKTMLNGSVLGKQRYLRQVQNSQFFASLHQLFTTLQKPSSLANDILVEALNYQMFYHLVTEYPSKSSRATTKAQQSLQLANYYLKENYQDSNCTIEELCHHLNISRSYLYSLFKTQMNISPQKYLTHLRMTDAQQQLRNTDDPIQIISRRVGYKDEFTFSKAFKRYSGFSPKMYRQNRPY
ncbi:AraC family transcriptional regulator [Limosilactobacillus agrestimuris]|uniref:AraC family transcriptional regulator n=1 Tax=Limosilactobacillus agrestimuris TaxID=2941331 RepID=UPI00203E5862|nr:AraC family ligand binding domain-containing protein [Limosilactobacillus agrestimuris]